MNLDRRTALATLSALAFAPGLARDASAAEPATAPLNRGETRERIAMLLYPGMTALRA